MTPTSKNLFCSILGLAVMASQAAFAAAEIQPPWKLNWGEAPKRIEHLLSGSGARVVSRHPANDGSEAWEVDGIAQDGLKRTVFYFRQAALVGVELQFRVEGWTQDKYDKYMNTWRQSLEHQYGQGQLIARKTEPLGDVTQTVVGYKWNQNNTMLELVFFSASTASDVFRTLSVHYKSTEPS